ncbi:LysR family transcriptional regulator [Rhizobiales bacterium]|uniref:LysR family transcriptional regulator n=1 Tax=Hongsoonwoonella zoysiae TaxID=2821844 RepID=UPI00156050DD|nr:LysR family transcriptional regulator [Hongsoonwoonella zoysiae]NRG18286.1 LysR family transcriptional regulator [Hongsoonwoonella zoysiae]
MAYVSNLKTFVRVYELGSMSAAGRDLRVSAAVASSRISELEKHLGVRLFHRTTRSLRPTQQGEIFYKGATRILETIDEVEGQIAEITASPKGTLFVAAPLGLGKKLITPLIPEFKERYPDINVRLRLSDRKIDVANEGLDLAFVTGDLTDSELRVRHICDFERILCASPSYIAEHGMPRSGDDLVTMAHKCLLLRYPGASEFFWMLKVDGKLKRYDVSGSLESDDGDVLTSWALAGCGIVNKPLFEVAALVEAGELVKVAADTPPTPLPFSCVYPHKRLQDPKARLFIEHIVDGCHAALGL